MLENELEKVLVRDAGEFEILRWQLVPNEVAEHSKT